MTRRNNNHLDGYIRCEDMDYITYENGLHCYKSEVFDCFPDGGLVIFDNSEDSINVFCHVIPKDYDAARLVKNVSAIRIPHSEIGRFSYMVITPPCLAPKGCFENECRILESFYSDEISDGSEICVFVKDVPGKPDYQRYIVFFDRFYSLECNCGFDVIGRVDHNYGIIPEHKGSTTYTIFENGLFCYKRDIFRIFSTGLIAYTDHGKYIVVHAHLTNNAKDVRDLVKVAGSVVIPQKEEEYHYMFLVKNVSEYYDMTTECLIVALLDKDACLADVYQRIDFNDEKKTSFLAIKSGGQDVKNIINDYGVVRWEADLNKIDITKILDAPAHNPNSEVHKNDPNAVLENIRHWLTFTPFSLFYDAISSRVAGQEELSTILTHVYTYLQCIAEGKKISSKNILLAAPSGCGKTETYRVLKDYFHTQISGFVVSLIDINQITEEGFKGKNTSYVVQELADNGSDGVGIVFMDEFDKRLVPNYEAYGRNINEAIQGQLLTLIEGTVITYDENPLHLRKVDTSKTMFIAMGSFGEVRKSRTAEKTFGFDAKREEKARHHYADVTLEEMLKLGASFELLGRFDDFINYSELSDEMIDKIIDMRVKEISESNGIRISLTEEMRRLLHDNANTEFGNRLIAQKIKGTVSRAKSEINRKQLDAEEIIISGDKKYKIRERKSLFERGGILV